MNIEVNTRHYEFAHGKKPRGEGSWAFDLVCKDRRVTVWHNGSYAKAKKAAIADAKEQGASSVIVLS